MSEATLDNKVVTKKKSSISPNKIIYFLFYYLIVAILLISGIAKIIDPLPIVKSLEAFKLFSFTQLENELNIFIATTLPIFEIALALFLALKVNLKIILPLILLLFSAFLIYAIYGYYLGITNDCGCFGSIDNGLLSWSKHGVGMIVRNFVFLFLNIIVFIIFLSKKRELKNFQLSKYEY